MLKLAAIFALALGCHGVNVPSMKLEDGEIPTVQEARFSLDPVYYLYRKDTLNALKLEDANINQLDDDFKTIFLVHGHGGSPSTFQDIRFAILQNAIQRLEDVNVILMDWQYLAANSYSQALNSVDRVANHLNEFITKISAITGTTYVSRNNIQIVGFNLGAHVAGIAARGLNIARITGLDPSGDGWGPRSGRLTQTDANYVEVIHTDGGLFGNGIGESIGSVNFYVNGGSDQPGCYNRLCSHNRALEVYAASISKTFDGYKCESTTQINLNRCRGQPAVPMGNTEPIKFAFGDYRANTGRPPF